MSTIPVIGSSPSIGERINFRPEGILRAFCQILPERGETQIHAKSLLSDHYLSIHRNNVWSINQTNKDGRRKAGLHHQRADLNNPPLRSPRPTRAADVVRIRLVRVVSAVGNAVQSAEAVPDDVRPYQRPQQVQGQSSAGDVGVRTETSLPQDEGGGEEDGSDRRSDCHVGGHWLQVVRPGKSVGREYIFLLRSLVDSILLYGIYPFWDTYRFLSVVDLTFANRFHPSFTLPLLLNRSA